MPGTPDAGPVRGIKTELGSLRAGLGWGSGLEAAGSDGLG